MNDSEIVMNPNELVQFLKKPAEAFTRNDLVRFCEEREVKMLNFRYVAEDGRLKTLNFVITSKSHLETILTAGERVDGSNLFSFMDSASSDLYVIPLYRTAFLNPFAAVPTLELFCSFYDSAGRPLESDPGYILHRADDAFTRETGMRFLAFGELEYYVVAPAEQLYPGVDQKGYHESAPFASFGHIRNEAMLMIARAGGIIKYGHSEVGCFTEGDTYYEQHEIEFLPAPVEQAARQIILAKWILRMLGRRYGVEISFAPKIAAGMAGSGMHFHMMIEKDGENLTAVDGRLSDSSRKMIAGILDAADALTAFGNTIPTSYLRLVPEQEAPTKICWGDRNRSVVIRVPLGWNGTGDMVQDANPLEPSVTTRGLSKQTFEFRVPDGSADICLTLAGLLVTSLRGLKMPDALERARQLYVDEQISVPGQKKKMEGLRDLPLSCVESAEALEKKRRLFEVDRIFPPGLIESRINRLKSFNDRGLSEQLYRKSDELRKLVDRYIHVG
ncbi:MAG: glutamine synthetase [Bacteroidales bacterium]|nr:glutamine synthetase [Bacteroidales bacterium]MBN2699651.1 glutamine synthetase [Bacteroidales bacterium]